MPKRVHEIYISIFVPHMRKGVTVPTQSNTSRPAGCLLCRPSADWLLLSLGGRGLPYRTVLNNYYHFLCISDSTARQNSHVSLLAGRLGSLRWISLSGDLPGSHDLGLRAPWAETSSSSSEAKKMSRASSLDTQKQERSQ
jgi:hypothetical protein